MSHDSRPIKEERVKSHVKKLLKKYAAYYFMPVQSGYGGQSLDFLCSHKSRFFAIETKAPGHHLTPRQELIRTEIEAGGGVVFVIGEFFELGDHHFDQTKIKPKLKKHFSGMEELEGWLLLG